jgi:hypothetical protein
MSIHTATFPEAMRDCAEAIAGVNDDTLSLLLAMVIARADRLGAKDALHWLSTAPEDLAVAVLKSAMATMMVELEQRRQKKEKEACTSQN